LYFLYYVRLPPSLNSRRRVTCCALDNLEMAQAQLKHLSFPNHLAGANPPAATDASFATQYMAVPSLTLLPSCFPNV
jgi:hypothetical protein